MTSFLYLLTSFKMAEEATGNGKKTNLPSHEVYLVREGVKEGDKAFWNKVGAAWPHKDGKGFAVVFVGDFVMRESKPKEADPSPSQ